MPSANLLKQWMWTGVGFVAVSLVTTNQVYALTAHQTCPIGSPCTIGEFVYSDTAVAITNATCQFTSFTPSGTSFVNAASLTGTADGWYAYLFTPDQDTAIGTYPTQLCCQTSENDLCIDKTFEVAAAPNPGLSTADVSNAVWNATISGSTTPGSFGEKVDTLQNNSLSAADIWSYSSRTLSNFGTLLTDVVSGVWSNPDRTTTDPQLSPQEIWEYSDRSITNQTQTTDIATTVWNYQSRSLTSFGNLVSSIWSADNRTATDPNGATAASIAVLEREIKAAQALIGQLAAGQTTSNPSTTDTPDYAALLETKLATSKEFLSEISNGLEIISTRLGLLAIKWDQLSDTDRIQELEQILTLLGTTDPNTTDTLIGQINWFATHWPKNSTTTLYQDLLGLRTDINDFITAIQISPDDTTQTTIINQLFAAATSLKTDIGDISQTETSGSLYGQYKSNRLLAESLANQLRILANTLADWDRLSLADRDSAVAGLSQEVGLLNRFTALKPLLSPPSSTPTYLYNLKAVLTANQAALATTGEPVVFNWIGANATTYHTFIYNPSKTTAQTAAISYFLPTELTTENLSQTPPELTASFDANQNAIAVTGSPSLDPETHRLLTITSTDIWTINSADIDAARLQAKTLTASLEKSTVYPQAAAIKQNIDSALDTILLLQQQTRSPEAKIQAYRQIQTLRSSVEQGLQQLQNLANSSETTTSLMGFVGGVQAVAVWGMIVIVIAGFIFLSLYMRALYQQTQIETQPELNLPLSGPAYLPTVVTPPLAPAFPQIHLPLSLDLGFLSQRRFTIALIVLSAALLSAITLKHAPNNTAPDHSSPAVIAPLEPLGSPQPTAKAAPPPTPVPPQPSATHILISPPDIGDSVSLHRLPTSTSPAVATIDIEEAAEIATKSGDWLQVRLTNRNPIATGWLNQNFALILPE